MPATPESRTASGSALRIALAFALCSIAWIGVTDGIVPHLAGEAEAWANLSRIKGIVFIALCSPLLFVLVRRQQRELLATNALLERQKDDFRAVFTQNPHPMWLYDRQTLRILDVNRVAVASYGYSRTEFLSMTVSDLRPPEDRGRFLRYLETRDRSAARSHWRHQRKDGTIMFVDVKAQDTDFEGRAARLVIAVDITDRLKTDQEVRLAEAAFNSTREAIVIISGSGTLVAVNPAFTAMTGYASEECLGRRLDFLRCDRHPPEFYRDIQRQLTHRGRWQGELWSRRRDGSEYACWLSLSAVPNAAGRVRNYIGIASDLSDRKAAESQIHELAHYDRLTLLANRVLLEEQLDRLLAVHGESELTVLFIDFDHVKRVNDSLGHHAGDTLLRTAAARLSRLAGELDVVARWGGDEFVIVLPNVGPTEGLKFAENAIRVVTEPCIIDGHAVSMTASVGISVCPKDGTASGVLLRNASTAVHDAKERGGNRAHFFRPRLNDAVRERHAIETALRLALANDELHVHYQPQVALSDGGVVGIEALLRWSSAELGEVPPSKFIPIAEAIGLMESIGTWVLRRVCEQAAIWRRECLPTLRVAVNVSAAQLHMPDFVDHVRHALVDAKLDPQALEIEVTESLVVDRTEHVRARFDALLALGVRFAIDDFGTGYSSLGYLSSLPVQAIKIDQSFVRDMFSDPRGLALPQAIIAIGHNFGLRVVAEGVETREQQAVLHNLGCEEAQGYLFARPMAPEDATQWIRKRVQAAAAATPLHTKAAGSSGTASAIKRR